MTRAQLAEELGVSEVTVHGWEKGRSHPKVDKVNQMAALFGIHDDGHFLRYTYDGVSKEELCEQVEELQEKVRSFIDILVPQMEKRISELEEKIVELKTDSSSFEIDLNLHYPDFIEPKTVEKIHEQSKLMAWARNKFKKEATE